MKPKALLLLCVSALMCLSALAQTSDENAQRKRLDEVAASYTRNNAFMGTVLVAQRDNLLLNKGYGQADLEWSIPNAPEVKFRLDSLTKQFTAALVLLLQQDGKLNLQDPVSKYLPGTPAAWGKITLLNLLGHTSGIPNFTSDPAFLTWRMNPHSSAELLAFFRDKPLDSLQVRSSTTATPTSNCWAWSSRRSAAKRMRRCSESGSSSPWACTIQGSTPTT